MNFEHWFEILVLAIGTIGGWFLRTLWQDTKELASKVQEIELLVAGQYVSRLEFERFTSAVFTKLDKIEDKIDRKADK
jgi:hypothetical protein